MPDNSANNKRIAKNNGIAITKKIVYICKK